MLFVFVFVDVEYEGLFFVVGFLEVLVVEVVVGFVEWDGLV